MADEDDMQKAQALVNQLQVMKDEAQAIAQKISELDQERHEHSLVAETLEKLDSTRKCYRWMHPHDIPSHEAPVLSDVSCVVACMCDGASEIHHSRFVFVISEFVVCMFTYLL